MLNKKISRRSFLTISAMTAASFALDWKKIAAYAASMGPKYQSLWSNSIIFQVAMQHLLIGESSALKSPSMGLLFIIMRLHAY